MGLKINFDNRTEFVPNLIATSKVQLDCQDPVATSDRFRIRRSTLPDSLLWWSALGHVVANGSNHRRHTNHPMRARPNKQRLAIVGRQIRNQERTGVPRWAARLG